jgi:hypothetical protein
VLNQFNLQSVSRPGGKMGTVINLPRVRGREERPTALDASTVVIILPVVRIERAGDASSCAKASAAKSVSKPSAKPAPDRKRRKRAAPAVPAHNFGRG